MKFLDYQNERSENETKLIELLREELQYYIDTLTQRGDGITYSLKYTKDSYTLQEAKDEINKKQSIPDSKIIFTINYFSTDYQHFNLPCISNSSYSIRAECASASSSAYDLSTAL